jgi:hypothetical protein
MPTYDFKYKDTEEVFTKVMKIAEKEQYLLDNPNVEPVMSAPVMIDPVRLGVRKIDNGFKEVLQRVHEKTPGSVLNRTTNI